MAKIKLFVDTDILIDSLKGKKTARDLFRSAKIEIYCSILSKKELLSMHGLSNAEKKRINNLLTGIRILKIDDDISKKYMSLIQKYGERPDSIADYIIAATAWSKQLPLLTRN